LVIASILAEWEGNVYQALLADVRFHELLLKIDHDMLKAARDEGCHCGGVLHSARYKRKPKGLPTGLSKQAYCWRLSLCCAVDGCRQRRTPPSLRFLGRQVYLATTVVLISTMLYGATPARVARLAQVCGADRRTIMRWREWWRTTFTDSRFWQAARATFMPPIDENRLPASMLERFAGAVAEQLLALLRFLAPITGGAGIVQVA
jgi:hypothetical protein